ncbi:MAG: branched-chain amino acid ABC transporter permease [Acutalibacteraceae bacterium]|nr:branched-chain amino acid ABC transporter permease [Acutalibacteraceae bacterium]
MKILSPADKKKNTVCNLILFAALIAVLIYIDATSLSVDMIVKVLQKGCVYAIVVVSMNLLNGFTGLFSLGQAGFMLIGAYMYSVFSVDNASREMVYSFSGKPVINFQLPIIVAIILAGLAAALFSFLIGLPVLKLKSDYLAIATLGFAEILRTIIQWDKFGRVTNGSFPISQLNTFKARLADTAFAKMSFVIPFFIVAVICIGIITLMIHSTYGRAFKAIRDDEVAAEAMGINLAKHKMISFVTSSFFAGIGGALYAVFVGSTNAAPFTSALTYEILLIVVIGGIGSITGSILASFLYIASQEWWLRGLDSGTFMGITSPIFRNGFRLVVFSVIIMIFVLFFRNGIMGDREFSSLGIYRAIKNLPGKIAGKFKKSKAEVQE